MHDNLVNLYRSNKHKFETMRQNVISILSNEPALNKHPFPIIHSIKSRLKDENHLAEKIGRKIAEGNDINEENLFSLVTDFAGVRVLHLQQIQFPTIHAAITEKAKEGDWVLHEIPKAYTWDPEIKGIFESLGIKTEQKESYYTSIHYVVRPRPDSIASCEIQVRTLFEEIWGEIDHEINYPVKSGDVSCREQLRVLAKLVATGNRLVDSIHRTHEISSGHSK